MSSKILDWIKIVDVVLFLISESVLLFMMHTLINKQLYTLFDSDINGRRTLQYEISSISIKYEIGNQFSSFL